MGFIEKIVNGVIKGINSAVKMINKIPGVSISSIATVKLKRMASGGFATPGELFIAREAGPELVGSLGSQTAVMNNNQIVEAVTIMLHKKTERKQKHPFHMPKHRQYRKDVFYINSL